MNEKVETCGHDSEWMYLHSRCHTGEPMYVRVRTNSRELVVECANCDHDVARFHIMPDLKQQAEVWAVAKKVADDMDDWVGDRDHACIQWRDELRAALYGQGAQDE